MTEHGIDPSLPVLMPPPEQRIATAADVESAKNDMRREMRLWLLAGSALGQGVAAVLAVAISGRGPEPVRAALAVLTGLI